MPTLRCARILVVFATLPFWAQTAFAQSAVLEDEATGVRTCANRPTAG
jgi:hypothetical protein